MPPQGVDPTKDPDFLSAPLPEQSAYLASIDPDYASASPQDKLAYLGHITGKNLTLPAMPNGGTIGPSENVAQRTGQELSRLASSAVNSKFPYVHPFDAMGMAAQEAGEEIQHYAPSNVTEFLLGGQAAGKPLGTRTGFANNPILNLVAAPVAGEAAGRAIEPMAEQATASLPQASNAVTAAKNAIGNFVRDPVTGKLNPGTALAARGIGAAAGYEAGKQVEPRYGGYAGAILGEIAGPTVADALLPSSTNAMYEQRAQDLMRRGREQAALDRQAAREAAANAPLGSPENPGWVVNIPNQMPDAYSASTPKISSPYDPALSRVGNEGRAATWTNDTVIQLAKQGNREAIVQAVRRGLTLPENARYVMGDPSFRSGVYNPRDVTTFTPEGVPIRQAGRNPSVTISDPYSPTR